MHVVFISNCEKKAVQKTRAVLDRYATRIGREAWAAPFTQEGLREVHGALRRKATRQTSVACYRNDGRAGLRLVWIVGNRCHYDRTGAFAAQTQTRPAFYPMYVRHASLIARISGLLHDLGKATEKFQAKLRATGFDINFQTDKIRHEWISAWLISRMGAEWSSASLERAWREWTAMGLRECVAEDRPFIPVAEVRDADSAIMFCVATHHRLFGDGGTGSTAGKALPSAHVDAHVQTGIAEQPGATVKNCAITEWEEWEPILARASKLRERLAGIHNDDHDYWRVVATVARASLILADHEGSRAISLHAKSKKATSVWANSAVQGSSRVLNQTLLEHLNIVGDLASRKTSLFAAPGLPTIDNSSAGELLPRPSSRTRFSWQDDACDVLSQNVTDGPSLVFNVAGTGSGKTLANIKAAKALRPQGLRITSAFYLRSLTLQSRDAYIKKGCFIPEDVACVIGEPVIEKIHEAAHYGRQIEDSESDEPETSYTIHSDDSYEHALPEWINQLAPERVTYYQKLLGAPVLVTTADHIIQAGDLRRQAHHALAMLRVATSDLILDEADSYSPKDLASLLRVVETASMFGRNVIVSSATLPSVVALAIFKAWQSGCRLFSAHQRLNKSGKVFIISDKNDPVATNQDQFPATYEEYTGKIAEKDNSRTKVARIVDFVAENQDEYFNRFSDRIYYSIRQLHAGNAAIVDGTKVSIGLVRMANVTPLLDTVTGLMGRDDENCVYVTTYHARDLLARRTIKERVLDSVLARHGNPEWWKSNEETSRIVQRAVESKAPHVIFVVVASPVEEVGRDHDFDWAVIEPSSMISIFQTAGRVNRHRLLHPAQGSPGVNIHILNRNIAWGIDARARQTCYARPGYQIRVDSKHTHTIGSEVASCSQMLGHGLEADVQSPTWLRSPAFSLTSKLIFGESKCAFMSEDERGIHHIIENACRAFDNSYSWMNSWIYKAYPWREGSPQASFMVDLETRKIHLLESKTTGSAIAKNVSIVENIFPQSWLSPTLDDVSQFIDEMNDCLPDKKSLSRDEASALTTFSVYGNGENPQTITPLGVISHTKK